MAKADLPKKLPARPSWMSRDDYWDICFAHKEAREAVGKAERAEHDARTERKRADQAIAKLEPMLERLRGQLTIEDA